jgi:hypothetical protein
VSAKHEEDVLTVPSTEDASESTTFGGLSQTYGWLLMSA